MKKNLTTAHHAKKQAYMSEAEAAIVEKRPDLKGKFSTLRIWESLEYFYTCNGMTPAAAARRILDQYPPKDEETAHSGYITTTPSTYPMVEGEGAPQYTFDIPANTQLSLL